MLPITTAEATPTTSSTVTTQTTSTAAQAPPIGAGRNDTIGKTTSLYPSLDPQPTVTTFQQGAQAQASQAGNPSHWLHQSKNKYGYQVGQQPQPSTPRVHTIPPTPPSRPFSQYKVTQQLGSGGLRKAKPIPEKFSKHPLDPFAKEYKDITENLEQLQLQSQMYTFMQGLVSNMESPRMDERETDPDELAYQRDKCEIFNENRTKLIALFSRSLPQTEDRVAELQSRVQQIKQTKQNLKPTFEIPEDIVNGAYDKPLNAEEIRHAIGGRCTPSASSVSVKECFFKLFVYGINNDFSHEHYIGALTMIFGGQYFDEYVDLISQHTPFPEIIQIFSDRYIKIVTPAEALQQIDDFARNKAEDIKTTMIRLQSSISKSNYLFPHDEWKQRAENIKTDTLLLLVGPKTKTHIAELIFKARNGGFQLDYATLLEEAILHEKLNDEIPQHDSVKLSAVTAISSIYTPTPNMADKRERRAKDKLSEQSSKRLQQMNRGRTMSLAEAPNYAQGQDTRYLQLENRVENAYKALQQKFGDIANKIDHASPRTRSSNSPFHNKTQTFLQNPNKKSLQTQEQAFAEYKRYLQQEQQQQQQIPKQRQYFRENPENKEGSPRYHKNPNTQNTKYTKKPYVGDRGTQQYRDYGNRNNYWKENSYENRPYKNAKRFQSRNKVSCPKCMLEGHEGVACILYKDEAPGNCPKCRKGRHWKAHCLEITPDPDPNPNGQNRDATNMENDYDAQYISFVDFNGH